MDASLKLSFSPAKPGQGAAVFLLKKKTTKQKKEIYKFYGNAGGTSKTEIA